MQHIDDVGDVLGIAAGRTASRSVAEDQAIAAARYTGDGIVHAGVRIVIDGRIAVEVGVAVVRRIRSSAVYAGCCRRVAASTGAAAGAAASGSA